MSLLSFGNHAFLLVVFGYCYNVLELKIFSKLILLLFGYRPSKDLFCLITTKVLQGEVQSVQTLVPALMY